jgi:hypothetical protein
LEKKKNKFLENWKIILFSFIAPLILLCGKHHMGHSHYAFPFVSSLLVSFALALKNYSPQILKTNKIQIILVLVIIFGYKYTTGFTYEHMNKEVIHWQKCRAEIKTTWKKVRNLQKQGKFVFADPYTPSAAEFNHLRAGDWGIDWSIIYTKPQTQVILLKRPYFNRYYKAPSRDYVKEETDRWVDIAAFYKMMDTQEEVTDPKGGNWVKTHDDTCGHIIWEKI